MSYCRWSTDIKNTVPFKEYFFLLRNGVPHKFIWEKLQKRRHAEISDWYVFHHCDSGDTLEQQMIAVWHKKGNTRLISYDNIKWIVDTNCTSCLANICDLDELTQADFIMEVLEEVINDLESEYK